MSDLPTSHAAKQLARRLREDLATRGLTLGHGEALELVARAHGVRDWNTFAATAADAPPDASADAPAGDAGTAGTRPAVPILRIFDRAKAYEFYVDYLGFAVDWEHGGPATHAPLYAQVSRGATVLHLSEHHGDASPGGAALVGVGDVGALHDELHTRPYDFARPGVETEDWGRVMVVIDPFHNRIVFHEPVRSDRSDVEPRPSEAAAPIVLTYELTCTPETAYDAFTLRIADWWHAAYAPDGYRSAHVVPEVGGAVTMRLADGGLYSWGTVTAWDPPHHYAQTFSLAQDPDHPSTLDVTVERRDAGCTVTFEHGGWTAANVAGRARFSEWSILLDRFAAVAEGRPVPDVPAWVTEGGPG